MPVLDLDARCCCLLAEVLTHIKAPQCDDVVADLREQWSQHREAGVRWCCRAYGELLLHMILGKMWSGRQQSKQTGCLMGVMGEGCWLAGDGSAKAECETSAVHDTMCNPLLYHKLLAVDEGLLC